MSESQPEVVTVRNDDARLAMGLLAVVGICFGLLLLTGGVELIVPASLVGIPSAIVLCRVPRFGLQVTPSEVIVRNLGRTYRVPCEAIGRLSLDTEAHPSGLTVNCIAVHRTVGKPITARGTSSYSEEKVRLMEEKIRGAFPTL
jgi:integral membrane sensor domain MASE1